MAITVRKAEEHDLPALSASCLGLMKGNLKYDARLYEFEKKYVAGRRSRMQKRLHSRNVGIFVAEENGKYCGYLLVEKIGHPEFLANKEAHIDDVFVIPRMRRKGVGRMLLARAEEWAREKGMDYLGIETDAQNAPAAGAYQTAGFSKRRLRMVKWL